MKVIEVTSSPQGECTVQTKGFVGGECQQASKFLEDALGLVVNERKTPEFYAAEQQRQQVRQ